MYEWLKEFFFNAGVFKGTVRAVLVIVGVGLAAVPEALFAGAPIWVKVMGLGLAGVGVFLRAGEPNPKDDEEDDEEDGEGEDA